MPFIKGRYHINPAMGEALEAAREAEMRRASPSQATNGSEGPLSDDPADFDRSDDDNSRNASDDKPPIHRVEIEATEIVPSHSGRAQRGFVARVHRAAHAAPQSMREVIPSPPARTTNLSSPPAPETHVFSDHRDLVNFLRDELAKDSSK